MTPKQKDIVVDAIRKVGDGSTATAALYGLLQDWAGKSYATSSWLLFAIGGLVVYAGANTFAFLADGLLTPKVNRPGQEATKEEVRQ